MKKLNDIEPGIVFEYFEEICSIPHGSENSEKICNYLLDFAKNNNLRAISDDAYNVIIYKDATKGYENHKPIILQAHTDMVCQKDKSSQIDFLKDGLDIYIDKDFIRANGTTLGADNGIAVAMIMAILESNDLLHPPIEAVFTTDEEIGMIGAGELDLSKLNGKRMINIDSEESDTLTVSCAGGSEFEMNVPYTTEKNTGTNVTIEVTGLKGGHSGVEIDKGRINANILIGRILNHLKNKIDFDIISINGGTKANAITPSGVADILVYDFKAFQDIFDTYTDILKRELKSREETLNISYSKISEGEFDILEISAKDKLIYLLITTPSGVVDMSLEIENLVETSLNLGILKTDKEKITFIYALRSNKITALDFLEEKLIAISQYNDCPYKLSGRYNPWEYKENSNLKDIYISEYKNKFNQSPKIAAIHAGLECAVFAEKIKDLDCIAMGPDIIGAHTVEERLSISSTKAIFELLCKIIEKC